jgi:hypothetical protein
MPKRSREGESLGVPHDPDGLNQRQCMSLYGFSQVDLQRLHAKLFRNYPDEELLTTLQMLKDGCGWDSLSGMRGLPPSTVRTQVNRLLDSSRWKLDPTIRFHPDNISEMTCWYSKNPEIRGLVDVTPVFTHQSKVHGNLYTGKFKRACWKFEVWTTNLGVPFWCRGPWEGHMHDQAVLKSRSHPTFPHRSREHFLADKAYSFAGHFIVPRKKSKNKPLSAIDESFAAWHRKCRSKVEHFFARLKRFRFAAGTKGFQEDFITKGFRFLVWCFHVLEGQPPEPQHVPKLRCECGMKP